MKIVTFFSAKGGTGKTTFNMLLASFLRYKLGKRVLVLDFDGPGFNFFYSRVRELEVLKEQGKAADERAFFPIETVRAKEEAALQELCADLLSRENDYDVVVMDFPGSFTDGDAVGYLSVMSVLDLVVMPVELDGMIIAAAKTLATIFREDGQRTLLFFNRVHGREKPELYQALREWFAGKGLQVSENMVKGSVSMRKERDVNGYLRSTTSFPEKEIREKNPGILELLNEVVDYVGLEKTESTSR